MDRENDETGCIPWVLSGSIVALLLLVWVVFFWLLTSSVLSDLFSLSFVGPAMERLDEKRVKGSANAKRGSEGRMLFILQCRLACFFFSYLLLSVRSLFVREDINSVLWETTPQHASANRQSLHPLTFTSRYRFNMMATAGSTEQPGRSLSSRPTLCPNRPVYHRHPSLASQRLQPNKRPSPVIERKPESHPACEGPLSSRHDGFTTRPPSGS